MVFAVNGKEKCVVQLNIRLSMKNLDIELGRVMLLIVLYSMGRFGVTYFPRFVWTSNKIFGII